MKPVRANYSRSPLNNADLEEAMNDNNDELINGGANTNNGELLDQLKE